MTVYSSWKIAAACAAGLLSLSACQAAAQYDNAPEAAVAPTLAPDTFDADRTAILKMAGNYKVTFNFIETVSFDDGYTLKDPKISGGYEVVRVIEDTGTFISLQHILVASGDDAFPIKHWRQDWTYEPAQVLTFVGGNAWEMRAVPASESKGRWSQVVYQVDDSPRYGAVAGWTHKDGISQWSPKTAWRPLPRRDMTTRDDYHAINGVNRHAITPDGWVHEQENSKLVLSGDPRVLVREIGVNTYTHFDDFEVDVADTYLQATDAFWATVRDTWNGLAQANSSFALTVKGESEKIYMPLLDLAAQVQDGSLELETARREAVKIITAHTTRDLGALASRLRTTEVVSESR